MAIRKLRQEGDISDTEFDSIYPHAIRLLSARHWTSMQVARIVSGFLCNKKGAKILDIGSGVGKFCMIGATLHPGCSFNGVEFRSHFTGLSEQIKKDYDIRNVNFMTGDVIDIDFRQYDGIYFFNSFHEQIDTTSSLGEDRFLLKSHYVAYVQYLFNAFKKMPIGTRLVTYHTSRFFIPDCYEIVEEYFGGPLKLYKKTTEDSGDVLAERIIASHILLHGS